MRGGRLDSSDHNVRANCGQELGSVQAGRRSVIVLTRVPREGDILNTAP